MAARLRRVGASGPLAYGQALNRAFRLLAYRARSEAELRGRLERLAEADVVAAVVARVRELGLLDDRSFAAAWVEQRQLRRPRSARLLAHELASKGVSQEVAGEAIAGLDESESAAQAGRKRALALAARGAVEEDFRRQVEALLLRRGFSFEVAQSAALLLWEECGRD